jgi:hypothetical protein
MKRLNPWSRKVGILCITESNITSYLQVKARKLLGKLGLTSAATAVFLDIPSCLLAVSDRCLAATE